MLHGVNQAANHIISNAGFTNFGAYVVACMIIIVACIFLAFAVAIISLSKLAMWLLVATAPIFISLALFSYTSQFFDGWLKQTMNYALIPLFMYSLLGVILSVLQPIVDQLVGIDLSQIDWTLVGAFMFMCLIGAFLIVQVPAITMGIAGGTVLNSANLVGSSMKFRGEGPSRSERH